MRCRWNVVVTVSILVGIVGCGPSSDGPGTGTAGTGTADTDDYEAAHDDHGDHGHHGHAHSHEALGPHEGHMIEIGNEQYHAEWLHDDESGLVTVYILDAEMKDEVPIVAPTVTIEYTIGDKTMLQELDAVASESEEGTTAKFETTSKPLIEALKMSGQGVTASFLVEIDGETLSGSFDHAPH